MRVWGGGWLKYSSQTLGVDLDYSDTPVYEWYVVGSGQPGQTLDDTVFALWNKSAGDYLVHGEQTWSIGLNWYKKALPSGGSTPRHVRPAGRPLEMWVDDASVGSGWVDRGELAPQWNDGGCPYAGQPFTFSPTPGHSYVVESVDFEAPGCSDDPDVGSERSVTTLTGNGNGSVVSCTIG